MTTDKELLEKYGISRRNALLGAAGAGTAAIIGFGHLLLTGTDEDGPAVTVDAGFPSDDVVVGTRDDTVDPVTIPGETTDIRIDYENFRREAGNEAEFDVTLSVRPAFADEAEPLVSGTIDSGETPDDTVSAPLRSDAFDRKSIDLADHSDVSDDYAEFGPAEGGDRVETDLEIEVIAESRTYEATASETYTLTVTVLRDVSVTVTTDSVHESLVIDAENGTVDSIAISGPEFPVTVAYEGFDDVDERAAFTVTVLVRPAFAEHFESVATGAIGVSETPADSVEGVVYDGLIRLAEHSAVSSSYAAFESTGDEKAGTAIEVIVRVEGPGYKASDESADTVVLTVTEDAVTKKPIEQKKPRDPSKPSDEGSVSSGGTIVVDGAATNEPT